MLSSHKHVSTLPYSVDIINGILPKLTLKLETTHPDEIKIKDELVLHGMTRAAEYKIQYNTIGEF